VRCSGRNALWRSAILAFVLATSIVACGPRRLVPIAPCAVSASAESRLEIFGRPFVGEYTTANVFDHDLPLLFNDPNNYVLTTCGQQTRGVKGHDGYDWVMPIGTSLLAVADGRVVRAEQEAVTCGAKPGPGARVVIIESRASSTDTLRAIYGHLDRIDVKQGDIVHAGDVIGTSGNTGCSTAPHLHFSVARVIAGREVLIDPYGWHSQAPDPWATDPRGAKSIWLWKPSAAPRVF
jgi:murein DD-endopeptidase MepM/ murein hydrolase activator NlpD